MTSTAPVMKHGSKGACRLLLFRLHYDKGDRKLVGLGSYIVNAVIGCNGCHSAGPATEFAAGHNPFQRLGAFTPPKTVNPVTYLGGGRDFGQIRRPITSSHRSATHRVPQPDAG